jgi:multicomponent Na+:H+ antiporter subunit C
VSVLLAATAAALVGIGTYLVLQRKLSRVIIGVGLIGHGANVLLITAGRRGRSPIVGASDPTGFADPLPQALALTAIVISFGVTALLLALAYRSWLLTHDDEIADDVADREVARYGHSDAELLDAAAVEPVDPEAFPSSPAAARGEHPDRRTEAR